MRILLLLDRSRDNEELVDAARATGAEILEGHDVEAAVHAARTGEVDAILTGRGEIERLSRGDEQISSWLRHQIMNPLATVLGYAQLLAMGVSQGPESDRKKLESIAEHALRIRDLVNGTRKPEGVEDGEDGEDGVDRP